MSKLSLVPTYVVGTMLLGVSLTVSGVASVNAQAAQVQQAPDQLVRSVADKVLAIIRHNPALRTGSSAQMAELIGREIAPHFDFTLMTRLALGRDWRLATPAQQDQLVRSFTELLTNTYASAYSAADSGLSVEVEPLTLHPGDIDVQVKTRIRLPGNASPVAVDYSMYKSGPTWKVYDVSVDGVDLIATYRSSFMETVNEGGIAGLLESLHKKT